MTPPGRHGQPGDGFPEHDQGPLDGRPEHDQGPLDGPPDSHGQPADGRRRPRARPAEGRSVVEWLLIVAAVAGFAAVTGLALQRILESSTDDSADPAVRILEAEVLAAEIEAEARQAGSANLDAELRRRCREISQAFPDVVERARWDVSDPDAKKCQIEALSLP